MLLDSSTIDITKSSTSEYENTLTNKWSCFVFFVIDITISLQHFSTRLVVFSYIRNNNQLPKTIATRMLLSIVVLLTEAFVTPLFIPVDMFFVDVSYFVSSSQPLLPSNKVLLHLAVGTFELKWKKKSIAFRTFERRLQNHFSNALLFYEYSSVKYIPTFRPKKLQT